VLVIGILSQGTGIFGGLILLDRRENTFCVPVNRASSVLAGVVGSYGLVVLFAARPPSDRELLGALLIILAIVALTVPPAMQRRRQRRTVGAAVT
jgi:drug/metabolite transporter (DMT)-like permease